MLPFLPVVSPLQIQTADEGEFGKHWSQCKLHKGGFSNNNNNNNN